MEEVRQVQKEVAEGVFTAAAAAKLCQQLDLDLPIIKAVAAILEGSMSCPEAVDMLMKIPVGQEITYL
jgi:glycerol-3-phosphate dehydrogenase (NAD(P)+)